MFSLSHRLASSPRLTCLCSEARERKSHDRADADHRRSKAKVCSGIEVGSGFETLIGPIHVEDDGDTDDLKYRVDGQETRHNFPSSLSSFGALTLFSTTERDEEKSKE